MLVLQLFAFVCLLFSAFCFFGPQLIFYGPKSLADLTRNPQAQGVASTLVMISVLVVLAPFYGPAAVDGGHNVSQMAMAIFTLDMSQI